MYQHGSSAHSSHAGPAKCPPADTTGTIPQSISARAGGDGTKAGIPERHDSTITKRSYQAPNEWPREMGK